MSHRSSVVASVVVVALVAGIVAFVANDGFGLFNRQVDVLLIGDSIMSQSGPYVADDLGEQPGVGAAKVRVEATPGSGLLTPSLVDWQERAARLVDHYRPKIVVVLFVGNYTDKPDEQWVDAAGQRIPNEYDDAFWGAWRGEAERLTHAVGAYGAQVSWVLPPPLINAEGRRREANLRATYEAVQREIGGVTLIDARPALGGPDGEFVWQRPNVDGVVATVRTEDSLHLTSDGGRLLARQMVGTVAPQLLAIRQRERRP